MILNSIIQIALKFETQWIDFVCDRYPEYSIKGTERAKQEIAGSIIVKIFGKAQKVPRQWKKCLSSGQNKKEIMEFLFNDWKQLPVSLFKDFKIYLCHEDKCHLFYVEDRFIGFIIKLRIDRRIEMRPQRGWHKDSSPCTQCIKFWLWKHPYLLSWHWRIHHYAARLFFGFQQSVLPDWHRCEKTYYSIDTFKVSDETSRTLQRFVRHLFSQEKKSDLLPPTLDVLQLHIRRANYQCFIWKYATQAFLNMPDPVNNSWVFNDESLEILWMTLPIAPDSILCFANF